MTTIKQHDIHKIRVETPQPVTYNTGDCQPAYEKKDEFFKAIVDGLTASKVVQDKTKGDIKTEIYNLGAKTREEITAGNTSYPASDDKLWALIYHDRIIAGMLETRTDFNYVNFSYFQNLENLLGCPKS